MHDLIQSALTVATEITAIAGITGIMAHAAWKFHTNWMSTYCPPVKAENPTTDEDLAHYIDQLTHGEERVPEELISDIAREVIESLIEEVEPEEAIADPWEAPATTSSRRWVSRQTQAQPMLHLLPPAKEEVKPATKPQPAQIDLNALNAGTLRKLCTQYGIAWRDVRGKNRHATKGMMIFQLNQQAVA
jgi:hypothetical protein